jgi:hypothetical protein
MVALKLSSDLQCIPEELLLDGHTVAHDVSATARLAIVGTLDRLLLVDTTENLSKDRDVTVRGRDDYQAPQEVGPETGSSRLVDLFFVASTAMELHH